MKQGLIPNISYLNIIKFIKLNLKVIIKNSVLVKKLVYNRYIVFPISQLIKTMTDNGNKLFFYF